MRCPRALLLFATVWLLSGCYATDEDIAPQTALVDLGEKAWLLQGVLVTVSSDEAWLIYQDGANSLALYVLDPRQETYHGPDHFLLYNLPEGPQGAYIAADQEAGEFHYYGVDLSMTDGMGRGLLGADTQNHEPQEKSWDELVALTMDGFKNGKFDYYPMVPISAGERLNYLSWKNED